MSARVWIWATLACGLATMALFAAFALLPEMRAAAQCLPPGSVVQFELARNAADLAAIFGSPDSDCRQLAVAAMDALNRLDTAAFIPVYTAFCIAGALFLSGGAVRLLTVAAVAAAMGAAAADYVETTTLLAITQSLDAPEALLPRSQAGAWAKFALLAAHAFFCAGLSFFAAPRRVVLGVLMVLPALGVAVAAFDHARFANIMNGAFALAWIGLLVAAANAAVVWKRA